MERESRKRGREDENDEAKGQTSKKQEMSRQDFIALNTEDSRMNHQYADNKNNGSCELSDDELELGVFDFPWLKEGGMISTSEDWSLEDTFSSFLQDTCTTAAALEFSGQCFCESPEGAANCLASTDIVSVEKFEENVWSLEMEGFSTKINQPLQQEGA